VDPLVRPRMCFQVDLARTVGPEYDDRRGRTYAATEIVTPVDPEESDIVTLPRVAPERVPPIPTIVNEVWMRGRRSRCARASEAMDISDPWSIRTRTW